MRDIKHTFARKIEFELIKQLSSEQATVITGMRRVGKTTLLRRVFNDLETDNKKWFDFENPLEIKRFEEIDYNHIVDNLDLDKKRRMFVFIDEIQHFPEISRIIKYLIDHHQIKFVVTGSASYYLKNLFPESLAGRKQIFELFPLDFSEFLLFQERRKPPRSSGVDEADTNFLADLPAICFAERRWQAGGEHKAKQSTAGYARGDLFQGEKHHTPKTFQQKAKLKNLIDYERFSKLFAEFVRFGGFPEVVLESDLKEKEVRLKEIFSSYYEKEVMGLSGFRKSKEIRDLIILITGRMGSKLDMTKISQELGVNRLTVGNFLHFLEKTYFIYLIPPFSRSVDREIAGRPKVYFCDNGLAQVITQVNSGQLLENAVFNLLKFYGKINYYQRRKSEQEIDFVLNNQIGFEVKETGTKTDLMHLTRLAKNLKLSEFYLISKNFVEELEKVIYPQFL